MENKSYGRKEVRPGKTESKRVRNRFILFTTAVLVVGVAIGVPVGRFTKKDVVQEQVQADTTEEQLEENVNEFGSLDGRIFTSEVSMDWAADDSFVPLDVDMDESTQQFVYYLSEGYNIDWTLVMAVIKTESDFDSQCVSITNDYGYMQINECNADWLEDSLGITDLLDSKQNIRAGAFVLRKLFEEYGDTNMVLMSYNMGETGAARLWNEGIYETHYTATVQKYQQQFTNELEGKEGEE